MDFNDDDTPIIPRSSKQAKMLGMGMNDIDPRQTSISPISNSTSLGMQASNGSAGSRGRILDHVGGATTVTPSQHNGVDGLQGWNGWGTRETNSSSTSTQTAAVPPWTQSNNGSANDVSPACTPFTSDLITADVS